MIKFSEGQYYYNDIRVRSANTAMDINGNKHWKLFLENGDTSTHTAEKQRYFRRASA